MKTKPDDAVASEQVMIYVSGELDCVEQRYGLTKREYFAALAMQSCILRWNDGGRTFSDIAAVQAVEYADTLIKELSKEQK